MKETESKRAPVSDELDAMSKCYEVLKELPVESRVEIMSWLNNRIDSEQPE